MHKGSFENLLSVLYGASAESADFTPFLHALGDTLRSHVLAIQTFDARNGNIQTANSVGLDLSWADTYSDVAGENLWYARGAARLLSEGVCDDEQMDCAKEMRRTRFHADFLRPTDIEHAMAFRLNAQLSAEMSVLTVNRSSRSGHFDDAERQLAKKLLPHLQNALALNGRLQSLEGSQRALKATLNNFHEGIFHLTSDGIVVFANEAGQLMEMNSTLVCRKNSRLVPVFAADSTALYKALQKLASGFSGTMSDLQLHAPDGRLGGLLTLCPVPESDSPWSTRRVVAIAFVRILDQPPPSQMSRLQQAWGLTRAEGRLAELLVRGLSLDDVAGQTGVSKNTVRSQVRSMYEKTGTHRQGELVALLFRAL